MQDNESRQLLRTDLAHRAHNTTVIRERAPDAPNPGISCLATFPSQAVDEFCFVSGGYDKKVMLWTAKQISKQGSVSFDASSRDLRIGHSSQPLCQSLTAPVLLAHILWPRYYCRLTLPERSRLPHDPHSYCVRRTEFSMRAALFQPCVTGNWI